MAYKRMNNAQSPKVDAKSFGEWIREWHPAVYAIVAFLLAWLGPAYTFWVAVFVGVGFYTVVQIVRVYLWRKSRIDLLAENGMPNPGLYQLLKDWKTEIRRLDSVRKQFGVACRTAKIQGEANNKKVPYIRNMRTTANMDVTGEIVTAGGNGVTVSQIVEHAPDIAEIGGAHDLAVRRTKSVGHAELTWYFTDPIGRILRLSEVPPSPKETLAYGVRQDGSPAFINMHQSVLIGGLTRKGKSVTLRALIADCVRKNIPVDFYFGDTKKIQFAEFSKHVGVRMGNVRVARYETTVNGIESMFAEIIKVLDSRSESMNEIHAEQHQPTLEEPLIVAVLDESLDLNELLRKGSKGDIGRVAYTGAAKDCVVWMCAQLGDKNAVGDVRDLIPQAICFATKTWQQTDAVLGTAATQGGAACHTLGDTPGVGWSASDDSAYFQKFRAANVTKKESMELAYARVPAGVRNATAKSVNAVCVYRARSFPDATGGRQLLYIGKTSNPDLRFKKQHVEDARKPWWCDPEDPENEVDYEDLYEGLVWYDSDPEALLQEELAIKKEKPLYNTIYNLDNPGRRSRAKGRQIVEELSRKELKRQAKELNKTKKEVTKRERNDAAQLKHIEKDLSRQVVKPEPTNEARLVWPLKPIKKEKVEVNGVSHPGVWGSD